MFKQKFSKILKKGGTEKMKKLTLVCVIALGLGLVLTTYCFARTSTYPITVTASIPTLNEGLSVTVTPISEPDGTWGTPTPNAMAFGSLTADYGLGIFTASKYFAVDVSVFDNTGLAWYINHTKTSIERDTTNNLNYNVNVSFIKMTKSGDVEIETPITKKVFAESAITNNTTLSKTALAGGWLRIYYGIATGDSDDAPNALPVLLDKRAGTYTGGVTLTLYPY